MPSKIAIIGLDCADPRLVFEQFLNDMPNVASLMRRGVYGELRTTHPPITVPAWTSSQTGKDPGRLGFYGFRNRKDYSYDGLVFATGALVRDDRTWDILGRAGKKVITVAVPQTYPPTAVNGCMVTGFLTPSTDSNYTYPAELKEEIARVVGDYQLDCRNFRTNDKDNLLQQIYEMTDKRFALCEHLLKTKPWDFFMMVEIGVDRLHHGFWKYCDPEHPKFEPGNKYRNAFRDYYRHIDELIGRLIELMPDDTGVMIISDHGARPMQGGICVNEWLIRKGWLTLAEPMPTEMTPISKLKIDWSRTKVWSEGGYYARVFLNVEGREPNGIVPRSQYESFRQQVKQELIKLGDENGRPIGTTCYAPEELYETVNGIPPDLICYFGDLSWRSVGSVGHGKVHTFENDTGPDDANHDWNGIFVYADESPRGGKKLDGLRLIDVGPTVLKLLHQPVPGDWQGKPIDL